jgi:hypothetical protein
VGFGLLFSFGQEELFQFVSPETHSGDLCSCIPHKVYLFLIIFFNKKKLLRCFALLFSFSFDASINFWAMIHSSQGPLVTDEPVEFGQ